MHVLAEATLYPPEQYSPFWLWLGTACLVAVVLGYAAAFLLTRPGTDQAPDPATAPPPELAELKRRLFQELTILERRSQQGNLADRSAFLELSALLRRFAFDATGRRAHTATLAELSDRAPGSVTRTVAGWYASEFEEQPAHVSLSSSLARVREVVATWS